VAGGGAVNLNPVMSVVYVDAVFVAVSKDPQAKRVGGRTGHRWCHMWSEDVNALHELAQKIGMRREWFQDRRGFPHYDLVPSRRAAAIALGAVEKPLMDYLREKREKLVQP